MPPPSTSSNSPAAGTPSLAEHPVQAVCRMTGLSPDVLRIWERRYEAVTPQRSPGGQRVYSDGEVSRLRMLAHLVARGHRIGQLARRSDEDLSALLAMHPTAGPTDAGPDPLATQVLAECLQAASGLDAAALDAALQRASALLGLSRAVDEVHAPFLREVGRLWGAGSLAPSHEHFGTMRLRTHLLSLILAQGRRSDAPRLLATTPSGERHEFGALLAAVVAAGEGWEVTYLGPDVPARDIAAAAIQIDARAIALSAVHPEASADVREELRELVAAVPPSTRVLIGGEWCLLELRHLARAGIHHVASLAALREELRVARASRPA